jgi:nitrate reductase beta subunit
MYRYLAIANYEDRFVVPSSHREQAREAFPEKNGRPLIVTHRQHPLQGQQDRLGIAGGQQVRQILHRKQAQEMYRYLAIANYEDRFVVPSSHREQAREAFPGL